MSSPFFTVPDNALCFYVRDYYEAMDDLEKSEAYAPGAGTDVSVHWGDSNLFLTPNRFVVPSLNLSFRTGLAYAVGSDPEDLDDILAVYPADEKSPWDLTCFAYEMDVSGYLYYSNQGKKISTEDLLCYIDLNENVIPAEICQEYGLKEGTVRTLLPKLAPVTRKSSKYEEHLGDMVFEYLFKRKSYAAIERAEF